MKETARMHLFYTFGIAVAFLSSCSGKGELLAKKDTLSLTYITWACECARWATDNDMSRFEDDPDSLAAACIFVEPENDSVAMSDTIGVNGDRVEFIGSFYEGRGFPKGIKTDQPVDKARVFKYTRYRIIKSNYRQLINSLKEDTSVH